jgi:hypothetical protein
LGQAWRREADLVDDDQGEEGGADDNGGDDKSAAPKLLEVWNQRFRSLQRSA